MSEKKKQSIWLGSGFLTWPEEEHMTSRFGTVYLLTASAGNRQPWNPVIVDLEGRHGTLKITTPREVVLGTGTFFREYPDGIPCVGVSPDQENARGNFWLDPTALYQFYWERPGTALLVELVFERDFQEKPIYKTVSSLLDGIEAGEVDPATIRASAEGEYDESHQVIIWRDEKVIIRDYATEVVLELLERYAHIKEKS